jgi:hypothetical protein
MKVFIPLLLAAGCLASIFTPTPEDTPPQTWSPETQQKIQRHSAFRVRLYDCKERLAQGSGLREAAADLITYCEAFYPSYLIHVADAETGDLAEAVARNLVRLFHDDQAPEPSMVPAYRATRFRLERELQDMESRI